MKLLNSTRRCGCIALSVLLPACNSVLAATPYPQRPVTMVNPYAAGTAADLMMRVLSVKFQETFGQPFVVVSRPGGSGVTGMSALVNAAPDGHTLAYTPLTPITIQSQILGNSRLGPGGVAPVCGVAENILGIVVRKDSPINSIGELVARARSGPSLSYGSAGINSGPSLGADDLARSQGVSFVHAPYQGDAPALQDLLAGRLDFSASVVASATPFVKAGSLRLLAVMSDQRHPDHPEVATLKQQGFPVRQVSYTGIFAPKGTPPAIVAVLDHACQTALRSDELRSFASKNAQVLRYLTHEELERSLEEQFDEQGTSLRAAGAIK